jgi:hypothetical protein
VRKFAHNTHVPVGQSKCDIAGVIAKYGGLLLDINEDVPGRAVLMVKSNHATPRFLRIALPLPVGTGKKFEQTCRTKWRALFIDIKGQYVSVNEGIKTFDQAFMAWIVGADGLTMYEKAQQLRLLPAAS